MAAPVLTSRQLQNVHTGLDMWVPEYQEIRGKMMTGHVEYQIVVVTNLPAFKTSRHCPEDVVQFVMSKKYSEIEETYKKISSHYPTYSLPSFPRKVLFVGETDIRERRSAFNDIVKAIAREKELATCLELQEFLVSSIGNTVETKRTRPYAYPLEDDDFFKDKPPVDDSILQIASRLQHEKVQKEEEDEEEEEEEVDFDPLGIMKTKIVKKKITVRSSEDATIKPRPKLDLFSEELDPDADLFEPNERTTSISKKTVTPIDDIKLFEEQDLGGTVRLGDSLLLPSACNNDPLFKPSEENTDDLFRIDEDFEKLLKLGTKPKIKAKPNPPPKPSFLKESKSTPSTSHIAATHTAPSIACMDESDILKYIKENESSDHDSLSLF